MCAVVGILALAVEAVGAVPAEKAHVVHHRVRAGAPPRGHRSRVDAVRIQANPDHDVRAALWRVQERQGRTHALKRWRPVGDDELRGTRMQADQGRVRLQHQRIGDDVLPLGT